MPNRSNRASQKYRSFIIINANKRNFRETQDCDPSDQRFSATKIKNHFWSRPNKQRVGYKSTCTLENNASRLLSFLGPIRAIDAIRRLHADLAKISQQLPHTVGHDNCCELVFETESAGCAFIEARPVTFFDRTIRESTRLIVSATHHWLEFKPQCGRSDLASRTG